jgi:hypothetical protein
VGKIEICGCQKSACRHIIHSVYKMPASSDIKTRRE